MSYHRFRCPDCGTTDTLHESDCAFDHIDIKRFEVPYIDILVVLMDAAIVNTRYHARQVVSKPTLVRKVEQLQLDKEWSENHDSCLDALIEDGIVMEAHGGLRYLHPDERSDDLIPFFEPLKTIYEYGPVDGAKDYAVYTMVSWCALKDMTWKQTKNFIREWLTDSGAWDRENWSESSINELTNDKKHVWNDDLGWGEMAQVAKREIDSAEVPRGIDIRNKRGATYSDYA